MSRSGQTGEDVLSADKDTFGAEFARAGLARVTQCLSAATNCPAPNRPKNKWWTLVRKIESLRPCSHTNLRGATGVLFRHSHPPRKCKCKCKCTTSLWEAMRWDARKEPMHQVRTSDASIDPCRPVERFPRSSSMLVHPPAVSSRTSLHSPTGCEAHPPRSFFVAVHAYQLVPLDFRFSAPL